ncbi:MAG: NAD(P)H:quinone oxidoreductase, type IV, partial [Erysipelothrix sp.]|nr:NAD(P)H:quinone oxidoreductase, type IV [Erysipelothrix sp.]
WGAFVVTPDVLDPAFYQAGGNPYGTSVTINREGDMLDDVKGAVQSQTKRLIEVATQFNN